VSGEAARLTCWFGEHDHAGSAFLADALLDLFARRQVRASCLLRGVEGFGAKHRLQSERVLTLSEDLPLVATALDARERIDALLDEVAALQRSGLRTLTPVRLLDGAPAAPELEAAAAGEAVKLTVQLGRQQRADGRPAHLALVEALHDAGVAGATVLLGIDGTAHGERRRARFLTRNAHVPLLVVSVGEPGRVAAALRRIETLVPAPLATLERVRVCKRDGERLAPPSEPAPLPADAGDGERWQQLTVYASEQSRHHGQTLHTTLVRRLRADGAAGATALRGVWGYHGDHPPHGDRVWSLRRRVPVVTTVLDRPDAAARWFATIDACTDETGLVTSETVHALP
jgi:PII-like signaling protein